MNAVPTAPHLYFPPPPDPEDPALLGVGRVVDAGLGTTGALDDDAAMDVRVDPRGTGDSRRKRRGRG
jgi:shikimate kinase